MTNSGDPGQSPEPTTEADRLPGSSPPQRAGASRRRAESALRPIDPERDLAMVAVGVSNVLLLFSLINLGFGLFPLRLLDTQWQLNQMSNLASNGPWILLALLLLHLGVHHRPTRERWLLRLSLLRRLTVPLTLLFLLLVPLQLAITWYGVETSRSRGDLAMRRSLSNAAVLKRVILEARDLKDLTRRVTVIPGAPPIPPEAASLPFETLRRTMIAQLDTLIGSLRDRMASPERQIAEQNLWRQSLRTALTNLVLAFGFASVSRREKNRLPMIRLLLGLPRRFRRLLLRLRPTLPAERSEEAPQHRQGGESAGSRRRRGPKHAPSSEAPPSSGGFSERWQRWKRRLRD